MLTLQRFSILICPALDFDQFKPVRFELRQKDARVNMRLPQSMLDALKAQTKAGRCLIYG